MTTPTLPFVPRRAPRQLGMWRWMLTGKRNGWYYLVAGSGGPEQFWRQNETGVIEHFARRHPGQRPWAWWAHSSPEPRRRLGGVGSGLHEFTAYDLEYDFGVPKFWRRRGDFCDLLAIDARRWPPIDLANPPRFESQATYLRRHGLFLAGERERLKPQHFWAEVVE